MAKIHAAKARALVGVRFRPQGRDPETGLDCVGMILRACAIDSAAVRSNYALRGDHAHELKSALGALCRRVMTAQAREGDILLMAAGPRQMHLGIRTERGVVHADAKLRRVVETPGKPPWPVIGAYRARRAR